jgi:hypothetical protein
MRLKEESPAMAIAGLFLLFGSGKSQPLMPVIFTSVYFWRCPIFL